ncbi:MAG: glycoside hydrolase family 99-like domain-containing protein [Alphaproteobacteria bacterium]|nr:glycoside hydrolase family 99-like domain-containing protein [Alphaproteobacteria bacterium]
MPGADYDDGRDRPTLPERLPARLIAFYLPQFHAIPENDAWWGEGFTEWTNVTKALPRFENHYQPRLPGALGFYDLKQAGVLRRQAEMARAYGIEGFCFHHYWFGGRRLLERPVENLLADRSIDLPFCVNWANENWSRRWDGSEDAVLMAQAHSPEDDVAFARSLEPLFDDPRYIRVGGRPLLMLYRPSLLPDAAATVERWREHFARRGDPPYIVMPQVFHEHDPRPYGMDAAAGFPPHRSRLNVAPIAPPGRLFDHEFRGDVRTYDAIARESIGYRPDGFRLFPGVCPDWDNDARSPGRGFVLTGSTPAKYGAWVEAAVRWIAAEAPPEERLVFINAWNEWAEGTYLEPDRHYGYAYLAAGARALARVAADPGGEADLSALAQGAGEAGRPRRLARRVARAGARLSDAVGRALRAV